MEISLQLALILISFLIVVGMVWDFKKNNKKGKNIAARREQNDFNEENLFNETVLVNNNKPVSSSKNKEMIVIHVMAKYRDFSGGELLDAFNDLHLYYGEMQIFYRYENLDGTGNLMFNLVSAVEPGYFEISKVEKFVTPGVTLFFTLTQPNQSIAAFELMLRTAKQLAMRLDGELIDNRHRLLNIQTIEQYRERIRKLQPEFRAVRVTY